jgi:putative SOS response-associated peptidase YedK
MCGRYELNATPLELSHHFGDLLENAESFAAVPMSYNIAPSTAQPVIRYGKTDDANVVDLLTWGFRPTWAKRAWINARAETLFTSTAFRESASKRRCLVVATGWYEWQRAEPKHRVPFYVHLDRPFAFAGVWTARKIADVWEKSFAIVTAPASPTLARIHDRMPLVLNPSSYAAWLDPRTERPAELIHTFDSGAFEAYPVSTYVNDPKNDSAAAVERAGGAE